MINDYIGGGQVFLHKLRMLHQVIISTFKFALIFGIVVAGLIKYQQADKLDNKAVFSYIRAQVACYFYHIIPSYNNQRKDPVVNVYTKKSRHSKIMLAKTVTNTPYFISHYQKLVKLFETGLLLAGGITLASMLVVFLIWSRFGRGVKSDRKLDGDTILSAKQVSSKLKAIDKQSNIKIGQMHLVKDSEAKHFLVTGATGSGKTNLIHNMLSQVSDLGNAAVIIDQTGEMIAKYYNEERGDIIFNPFDLRSHAWDFWSDCSSNEELARFTNILFSFNRRKHGATSDPFWEQSAEIIFSSCVKYLQDIGLYNLTVLNELVSNSPRKELAEKLANYPAKRFLDNNNGITAGSILSVLATNSKPIKYLTEEYIDNNKEKRFSIKEYVTNIGNKGSKGWLFLATKPGNRELTLPIIASLTDLILAMLMEIGIDQERKVWLVIDELAALGKLPALGGIMAEGRKYGACVLAGLQSLNQLYAHYGQYEGSTITGQFGTSFFFRSNEQSVGRMISELCGQELISKQQKNISFGANSFRDGQSYTEQEKRKNLVEYSDLSKLAVGECYVLMPEPAVRLAKIQVPKSDNLKQTEGFIGKQIAAKSQVLSNKPDNNQQQQQNIEQQDAQDNSGATDSQLLEATNLQEATDLQINQKQIELNHTII